jgi:tRNA threonylcarbamoyl adenosine modification protein (Sua5/YciO/YrdC/YwlC family)
MAEIQKIFPDHPQARLIKHAVEVMKDGGIIVYPTDTIYGLGADLFNKDAMQRILRIKKASKQKMLSFVCPDLKDISNWAVVPNYAYRIMRRVIPGQYTFILRATKQVPKILVQKRKTVGIRIPDFKVIQNLLQELGRPILSTSVPQGEDGYYTDPQEITRRFKNEIDLILDAGVMFNKPSTIVDFSADELNILREGSGSIDALYY